MTVEIDYNILNLYTTRQYDKCLILCNKILKEKSDRMIEFIRMRAMTIQAKIAGNGYEEVNYFPQVDDWTTTAVAKTPRPGTSFQRAVKTAQNIHTSTQPSLTATVTARARTARVRTTRALHTASSASRAATALASGNSFVSDAPVNLRFIEKDDKLFVPASKTLFEYIYYCECNVRKAMDVAFQAVKSSDSNDWWWNFSLARCYETLGMHRNVEECLRQALKLNKHVTIYLRLMAMYVGLDQPLSALEVCKQGLLVFHMNVSLLLEQARIHEHMGNFAVAVKYYRIVATEDPSNVEAIANIAMYNFYNDQPEIALRYYSIMANIKDVEAFVTRTMADFAKRLDAATTQQSNSSPTLQQLSEDFKAFRVVVQDMFIALHKQVQSCASVVDAIDMRQRQKIILFYGISEDVDDVGNEVLNVIKTKLDRTDICNNSIKRCHRLGPKVDGRVRPVLVHFCNHETKADIWRSKAKLKGSNISMTEFLTTSRLLVLKQARQHFGLKNVWTLDGVIYVKVPGGGREKVVSVSDLDMLKSKFHEVGLSTELLVSSEKVQSVEASFSLQDASSKPLTGVIQVNEPKAKRRPQKK